MKKRGLFIMLIAVVTAFSCSDDDSAALNVNTSQVINSIQSGNWTISRFEEDGNDETNHFTGFSFTFSQNGALVAQKGSVSYTGTWSVTNDSSDDDNPGSDIDFNIMFAAPDDFEDLSDDWDVLEVTNTKIRLQDISGGNGGTDYLTFIKN